jgi:hypothetical protein
MNVYCAGCGTYHRNVRPGFVCLCLCRLRGKKVTT